MFRSAIVPVTATVVGTVLDVPGAMIGAATAGVVAVGDVLSTVTVAGRVVPVLPKESMKLATAVYLPSGTNAPPVSFPSHVALIRSFAPVPTKEPVYTRTVVPTEFGLGVAAILTLARGYLMSQAEFITEEVREFSARLINALIDRPDVRLGHR